MGRDSGAILARRIRRSVLEQSKRAYVGQIGSSLSVADILAAPERHEELRLGPIGTGALLAAPAI